MVLLRWLQPAALLITVWRAADLWSGRLEDSFAVGAEFEAVWKLGRVSEVGLLAAVPVGHQVALR